MHKHVGNNKESGCRLRSREVEHRIKTPEKCITAQITLLNSAIHIYIYICGQETWEDILCTQHTWKHIHTESLSVLGEFLLCILHIDCTRLSLIKFIISVCGEDWSPVNFVYLVIVKRSKDQVDVRRFVRTTISRYVLDLAFYDSWIFCVNYYQLHYIL